MGTRTSFTGKKNPLPSEIQIGDYFESPNNIVIREVVNVGELYVNYTEWIRDFPADLTSTYGIYSTGGQCKRTTIRAWCLPKKHWLE